MSLTATNRRLATILFADIDGYSRMMRADEERTLVDLHAHLAELVAPVVERFHGRIVKTVGDGVMAEFGSAVEAVRSAVELQRGMAERNTDVPTERRQTFRIGLHLGDVIVSDDDIFGDTVNVAARLQGLAAPGSVVLSAAIHEQVRDKVALPFKDLGRRSVKNIDRPIRIYTLEPSALIGPGSAPVSTSAPRRRVVAVLGSLAVAAVAMGGGYAWYADRLLRVEAPSQVAVVRPSAETGLSVAVLVFTNQSGDPGQDYFSDGLTEDITRALGRFKQLTVISYAAVLPFRGKAAPLAEIGETLRARYLVGGTVRRMGQRVRVTVQLSDATTGAQLWAEQYDDDLGDIFDVQERIARRVAGTLAANLQQIALQQSLRKPTDNLDAYDLMLRGRAMAADATRAGNRVAREMLERAMHAAPGYADVHAELADLTFQRVTSGWSEFAQQDLDNAIRYAQKAVDLDPENVLGHSVLARIYAAVQKYELALAEAERALAINPSDAEGLLAQAAVLLWTGRIDESIASAEFAARLNSNVGPEASLNLGLAYLLARRHADAIRLLEAARNRYPTYPLLDFPLAGAYAELGRTAEAAEALEQGRRKNPYLDAAGFGTRFKDPALQRRVEQSLRKAGLN